METGSGRRRRGGSAAGLGRFQERRTMTAQETDTEQLSTRVSPVVTWPPDTRLMVGGGT